MCLMACLKALGILRWNLGSDIKLHELQSSAMVLIDVGKCLLGQSFLWWHIRKKTYLEFPSKITSSENG